MNMWYNRRESNRPGGEKRMNTVRNDPRNFLDEPGVKTLCYWCRGLGLIPGQETRSRVPQLRPEAAKKRKRSKKVSQRRRQWTECGKMSSIFLGCGEGKLSRQGEHPGRGNKAWYTRLWNRSRAWPAARQIYEEMRKQGKGTGWSLL